MADAMAPLRSSSIQQPALHPHPQLSISKRKTGSLPSNSRSKPASPEVLSSIITSLETTPPRPGPFLFVQGLEDDSTRDDTDGGHRSSTDGASIGTGPGKGRRAMGFSAYNEMALASGKDQELSGQGHAKIPESAGLKAATSSSRDSLEHPKSEIRTRETKNKRPGFGNSYSSASWVKERAVSSKSPKPRAQQSTTEDSGSDATRFVARASKRGTPRRSTRNGDYGIRIVNDMTAQDSENVGDASAEDDSSQTTLKAARRYDVYATAKESTPGARTSPDKHPLLEVTPNHSRPLPGASKSSIRSMPLRAAMADAIPIRTSSLRHKGAVPSARTKKAKTQSKLSHDITPARLLVLEALSQQQDQPQTPRQQQQQQQQQQQEAGPPTASSAAVDPFLEPDRNSILSELGEENETVKRIRAVKQQIRERRLRQSSSSLELRTLSTLASSPSAADAYRAEGFRAEFAPTLPPAAKGNVPPGPTANSGTTHVRERTLLRFDAPDNLQPLLPKRQGAVSDPARKPYLDSDLPIPANATESGLTALPALPSPSSSKQESTGQHNVSSASGGTQRLLSTSAFKGLDRLQFDPVTFDLPSDHVKVLPSPSQKRRLRSRSMSDARILEGYLGEEERRNSVDDAVDNFLHHERLSQTVAHPRTGRRICFSEVGDPNGSVVFVCVGMGLTRFVSAFHDELAATLRLRLITPDRPGVGGSEAQSERNHPGPLGWPDDVLAICSKLKITEFSILAHSAGAIYALATALVLPRHIHGKIHLLAPWIPPSQLESYGVKGSPVYTAAAQLPRSQRLLRILPAPLFKAANSTFLGGNGPPVTTPEGKRRHSPSRPKSSSPTRKSRESTSRAVTPTNRKTWARPEVERHESLMLMDQVPPAQDPRLTFPLPGADPTAAGSSPSDGETLILSATATPTDPNFSLASAALNALEYSEQSREVEYSSLLTERTWMLATRDSNPAVDLLVCLERNRDIGFRYMDTTTKVVITHGSDDKRVPVDNVRWIAEQMNRRSAMGLRTDGSEKELLQTIKEREICELRVLPGEGHSLMASASVMADCLAEISGEWAQSRRHGAKAAQRAS